MSKLHDYSRLRKLGERNCRNCMMVMNDIDINYGESMHAASYSIK